MHLDKLSTADRSPEHTLEHPCVVGRLRAGHDPELAMPAKRCQRDRAIYESSFNVSADVLSSTTDFQRSHLITLSARASTLGGIVKPICLAVFKLITSSNFVGCSMGRSAALAPFKILST